MKQKLLVGALTMVFVLEFISIAVAQTDPEFRNFVTRLNGSKWLVAESKYGK